eukprot:TRINITY_DN31_c0_g2_i1.p1 TRINITY_DN31_c0_g2~~TRINITY_DN31_c0_g2_i1.p1  ORF type:complete len:138 (-),score=55.66 TRINITY_DN31_c0_g2_i1:70-483(-)
MNAGVQISQPVLDAFQALKIGHSHRFVIFKLSDDSQSVIVDCVAPPTATYNEFLSHLPPSDCRYAIFDFEFEHEGGIRNKIVLVVWAPDSAKIKAKMLAASTKDTLKKALVGIAVELQATDRSEVDHAALVERVRRV